MNIQPNSSIPIPVGSVVKISQQGTGTVNISAGLGVTTMSSAPFLTIGQYRVATLTKTAVNTWYIEYSV
jgi:hypothetical protein